MFVCVYLDPPGVPQNFRVTDTSPKSISLAWDAPAFDGGSPVLAYTLLVATGSETDFKEVSSISSSSLSYKADRLVHNQQYNYILKAENLAGIGDAATLPKPAVAKYPFGKHQRCS